jgi:hypothetical protein
MRGAGVGRRYGVGREERHVCMDEIKNVIAHGESLCRPQRKHIVPQARTASWEFLCSIGIYNLLRG